MNTKSRAKIKAPQVSTLEVILNIKGLIIKINPLSLDYDLHLHCPSIYKHTCFHNIQLKVSQGEAIELLKVLNQHPCTTDDLIELKGTMLNWQAQVIKISSIKITEGPEKHCIIDILIKNIKIN